VRALHDDGMNVIVHCRRSRADGEALVAELNDRRARSAVLLQAELGQAAQCAELAQSALRCFGTLDVLINNASAFFPTPVEQTGEADWDAILGSNLKAPYFLSAACAPPLRTRNGCIVNLADIHGLRPLKGYPVYSAAKAGLIMLTQALARELGPEVRVNAVAPGPVLFPEALDSATRQRIVAHTALKRPGDPQDVIAAVRYLVDRATYVTGQVLVVDGGRTLHS
jgi:pteridine reductase